MMQEEQVETINQIRKRFIDDPQWLLIRVIDYDKRTTTPLTGVLLAHDPDRDIIFNKSIGPSGLILVDHSHAGKLPKGCVYAL